MMPVLNQFVPPVKEFVCICKWQTILVGQLNVKLPFDSGATEKTSGAVCS